MKQRISFLTVLWLAGFFCVTAVAQDAHLAAAKELSVRGGLPNFFKKLEAGKAVTIAYFGGSITEAANGWREQSAAWLQEKYPRASIKSVNAAIGGTGSDLGVFRLRQHVLVYKPDLVFVEFAVNDSKKSAQEIYLAMEGIVRQIWQDNQAADICLVYTLMADMAPVLGQGYFPSSATAMEHIADYYKIPSIHMGMEIVKMAKNSELIFKGQIGEHPGKVVFSGDNVHPYPETGHRLYTEALIRSLPKIAGVTRNHPRKFPKSLVAGNWEKAGMFSVKEVNASPGWQVLTPETDTVARQLQNRFTYLIKASQPGETITLRFKGTRFGMYDVMGPGCGQYEITLDGKPALLYPRFDEYCTYYRANYFFLPDMEEGIHTIELKVSSQPLDKGVILAKRNNSIDHPQKYQPHACYASQVMIIGELMK
jgi:lysophospholipase L1-like esterase